MNELKVKQTTCTPTDSKNKFKVSLINKIKSLIPSSLDKSKKYIINNFVEQYYAHVPYEEISDQDPNFLLGAALSLLNLGMSRKEGKIALRVFNPTIEENGWKSKHTIVEIINDDMPFIIDSIMSDLRQSDRNVHLVIHPIFNIIRKNTKIIDIQSKYEKEKTKKESFVHIEIDRQSSPTALDDIKSRLLKVLKNVSQATSDWPSMVEKGKEVIEEVTHTQYKAFEESDVTEVKDFLEWLVNNHFTFLGYREYKYEKSNTGLIIKICEESGLGVLQDSDVRVFEGRREKHLAPDIQNFLEKGELLFITKTNTKSKVHRSVHMDGILVKKADKNGHIVGERLFVGLFTSTAYSSSPSRIPFVRKKVLSTVKASGFDPHSHDGKALQHILETYPRDELFQIHESDLQKISVGILNIQERHRIALFTREDIFKRFISCLVYIPRDQYNASMRRRIEVVLETAFAGKTVSFTPEIASDSTLARVHFIIKIQADKVIDYNQSTIESQVIEAARNWTDHLKEILTDEYGEEQGLQLFKEYELAFPSAYQDLFQPLSASLDVSHIEEIKNEENIQRSSDKKPNLSMNLYRPLDSDSKHWRFKIYHPGKQIPLSSILPMLENMGVDVIDEVPFQMTLYSGQKIWIHDFGLKFPSNSGINKVKLKESFQSCFRQVWLENIENDGFNQLVLFAGISWREVIIIRAYAKYLRQAEIKFSQDYMQETLINNADIVCQLVHLFHSRFDPKKEDQKTIDENLIIKNIEKALDAVNSLDEDVILRRYLNLILMTLRTNFYQKDSNTHNSFIQHKSYLSFKLNSQKINDLPLPKPMVEVFIYSPRVEAIHLRGGKVARGGLRWSDRKEDFRTEILGLMKAQMVKNSVIVPVGSKGGFVVKHPPETQDREAILSEAIECYKIMIRGLLDITDNYVHEKISPPDDVIRYDDDDPYLVVAADKGTATFSDIANSVSLEYGFWLGDAFASGGSSGYDHKKMGITARGAWESVKRHFRSLNLNIQEEDFSVIGIGDMAGDVFGNGMLLSEHICLKAAFNHKHIFIDPEPNSQKSFKERQRLFALPRSAWSDYDISLISKGGGIFDRSAKSIKISKEIKTAFKITKDELTPSQLIQDILKSEVDLLWFGGIGTFIKASQQTHEQVGDRANEALRVDAKDLRCRVIAEGANLGVTQLGRIEFALKGGLINTDAIDNSAGVDCSDHEVNIKIWLDKIIDNGDLTLKQRNIMLEEMTEEVAGLVLYNNYYQTQIISQNLSTYNDDFDKLIGLMKNLEQRKKLNRKIENLPTNEEIQERKEQKKQFTAPEISVLLAYSKNTIYEDLLNTNFVTSSSVQNLLTTYFPSKIQKKYGKTLSQHPLAKEIVATVFTNYMINCAGPSFVFDHQTRFGATLEEVANAFAITNEIYDLKNFYNEIQRLDNKVPYNVQVEMLLDVQRLIEKSTSWLLTNVERPMNIDNICKTYKQGIKDLTDRLEELLPDKFKKLYLKDYCESLQKCNVPKDLAYRVSILDFMSSAYDIVNISHRIQSDISVTGKLYFEIGDSFSFRWLRTMAYKIDIQTEWEKRAVKTLVEDLYSQQTMVTQKIIEQSEKINISNLSLTIEKWKDQRRNIFNQLHDLMHDLQRHKKIDLAMLTVANRTLRNIIIS